MRIPLFALFAAASAIAQPPSPAPPKPAPPARPSMSAFPTRAPGDPEVVARGKAVYGVHCTFCHGADARGGSGGPNLIRTEVVLNDQDGELLGPVLREGRQGMPKFDLPAGQIKDISAFLHSFRVGGYDQSRMTPETIVVGNAAAGKAYFDKTCVKCHAAGNRDLKGIASQITDPKNLQQTWLMPGPRRSFGPPTGPQRRVSPTTVTVTLANGQKADGVLNRIDDFMVTLTDKEGRQRTFTRNGDSPKVEIQDPLAPHKALLPVYTDKDIHDVTAYLVTLK